MMMPVLAALLLLPVLAAPAPVRAVDVTVVATPPPAPTSPSSCPAGDQRQQLAVFVTPPEGSSISTAVFDLAYDAKRVGLPGSRNEDSVRARFRGFPEGSVSAINDRDGSVRVVVTGTKSLSRKLPLFHVEFDVCAGATPPGLDAYTCTVASCVATHIPVEGCSCRLEIVAAEP